MKKLVTISLFVFWAVVVAVLVAGLIFYQNNKSVSQVAKSLVVNIPAPATPVVPTTPVAPVISVFTLAEIAKHNSANDCWLLINNKVYDVTSFLGSHPGGVETIIPHCGQEATNAYNTKDIGRPHSARAASMLNDYYIGDLKK